MVENINEIQMKQQSTLQNIQQQPLVSTHSQSILCKWKKMLFLLGLLLLIIIGIYLYILLSPKDVRILNLVKLDNPSALCLDGSPASYYVYEGNPQKILILFVGGAWCSGLNYQLALENCYQRSFTQFGSSKYHNQTKNQTQGIFIQDTENYFSGWTIIELNYCDGTGHQGTKTQPIRYKEKNLYFRGHNITLAQFDSLDKNYNVFSSKIKQIALAGTSAGAVSTSHWINYFSTKIHPKTQLHYIADSAIFLNQQNFATKQHDLQLFYKNLINISNTQIATPLQDCNKAYPNQLWKCMFFEYFYPFIHTPVFLLQSQYDAWSLLAILKIRCQYGQNTIDSCSKQQKAAIQKYSLKIRNLVQLIGIQSKNGVWAPSCIFHSFIRSGIYLSDNWNVPEKSGNSAGVSIKKWVQDKSSENVYIDYVRWPNNHPCNPQRPARLF